MALNGFVDTVSVTYNANCGRHLISLTKKYGLKWNSY